MRFNKLFEGLDTTEKQAVKFAFENIASADGAYYRCNLIKLKSNGTTGYPVYYLYMVYTPANQSYVLRIIKQGRKCKLMSFGNPKLIYTFVGETEAKIPKRTDATLEAFTKVFRPNSISANEIVKWVNKTIGSNITLQDFGVNASERVLSGRLTGSPSRNTSNDKLDIVSKLLKKYILKKKAEKNPVIDISLTDFYFDNKKILDKDEYYPNGNVDKLCEDIYTYKLYKIELPNYTRIDNIHKPSSWLSSSYNNRPYIDSIKFISKPCKEFISLNKYIQNTLKCTPLEIMDISNEGVSGKRSRIFDRYGMVLLAHEPNKCLEYKKSLQATKKPNWKAKLNLKSDLDDADRYNGRGEDMECEWDGREQKYAVITFTTPSGKEMKKIYLYA